MNSEESSDYRWKSPLSSEDIEEMSDEVAIWMKMYGVGTAIYMVENDTNLTHKDKQMVGVYAERKLTKTKNIH